MNAVPDRGDWVRLDVRERSGRSAIGAVVSMTLDGRRLTRTVRRGFGYCASSDPRIHVGTPGATVRDVVVRWVDGGLEGFGDPPSGGTVSLRRGQGDDSAGQ